MSDPAREDIDPFTLELVRDSLVAVSDEMFLALQRTSKSPIIYEVLDYACGLTDAGGDMITQGNGVTGFLGTLTFAVRSVLDKFGVEGLSPRDVVITNDPYTGGGTHLSDVSLVVPVFYEGELVAFSAGKAHWTEVGGKDPGSWTTDSTEIFQEGIQFPCIKLFEAGRPVEGLIDFIAANVRLPDMTLGDMQAQASALRLGERRFVELCDHHGPDIVKRSIESFMDYGERMTRAELERLPSGTYEAEDFIDDDGLGNGPFRICVRVTISDGEMMCDFTGTAPQAAGPVNCTWTGLNSAVRSAFMATTNPHLPVNEGCFRPLRVVCPEGTIFTARRPAPTSTYWETKNHVTDLVWRALAESVPERLTAGHFLSVCGTVVAGTHPGSGELFLLVEPQAGGWGAAIDRDGESGLFCVGDGETYVIPVEVTEARHGVLVDRYELDVTDAGAGRHRGGRGCVRAYRALTDVTLTATFGRHRFEPWGVAGGRPGSPNLIRIRARERGDEVFGKCARYRLKEGDVACLVTGTGGGWGDPLERSVEAVVDDVRNGYVTIDQARRHYGVDVDPESLHARELENRAGGPQS
jgi:N-methylhydantoinase B